MGISLSITIQEYRGPIVDLQSESFIQIIGTNPHDNFVAPHLFLSSQKLFEMVTFQEESNRGAVRIVEGSRYCHDLIVKNLLSRMLLKCNPRDSNKFEIELQLFPDEHILRNGLHHFQIDRPEIMGITAEAMDLIKCR